MPSKMILPTRLGNTTGRAENFGWKPKSKRLTVYEVVSNGGTITQTIVVDVATLAVEVFGDCDQVSNSGGSPNVREILPGVVLQATLSECFPPRIHDIDLRGEIFEVRGV